MKPASIKRIQLLQQAALAAQDSNYRAAAHYTREARRLAILAGYRPTYGGAA